MADGTSPLDNARITEAPKPPKAPEAPKPVVGNVEKAAAGNISDGLKSGEDPDKILGDLASTSREPDAQSTGEKQQPDLDYRKDRVDVAKRARKELVDNDVMITSDETRNSNTVQLDDIHDKLASLDDPKNLEEARLMVTDYAETLAFLGDQIRIKNDSDSSNSENLTDLDPAALESSYILAQQSERVFMAACDKLFPDIKPEVAARDLKGNLDAAVAQIGDSYLRNMLKLDADALGQPGISDQYILAELTRGIGENMNRSVYDDSAADRTLKSVPDDAREDAIAAAKAMYIIRLSAPRGGISPAEMVIAKNRAGRNDETGHQTPQSETQAPHERPQQLAPITDANLAEYRNQGKDVLMGGFSWQVLQVSPNGEAIIERQKSVADLLNDLKKAKETGGRLLPSGGVRREMAPLSMLKSSGQWIVEKPIRSPDNPDRQQEVQRLNEFQKRLADGEFNGNKYGEQPLLVEAFNRDAQRLIAEKQAYEGTSGGK